MGKRRRDRKGPPDSADRSGERTLADAEADAAAGLPPIDAGGWNGDRTIEGGAAVDPGLPLVDAAVTLAGDEGRTEPHRPVEPVARCSCGSEEFVLEAWLAVVGGRPRPEPLEVESLTCPQCGREYEAIWLADGRVARGELRGQTDLDE